jgi:hypothetical protein
MGWIQKINRLNQYQKDGLYRILIPPSLFHMLEINPVTFHNNKGIKAVRFFCPQGDSTCLAEIKTEDMEEPVYSIQISDAIDPTVIEWDFLIINDPGSVQFRTHIDKEGKDTLFGWASRNLEEEGKALQAGYYPGQTRKGLGLSRNADQALEFFCRMLDIKSIRMEALFYHNAITYERYGYAYFQGYKMMKRIHELFQPGNELFRRLDNSTPFRRPEFARTIRGRSWAIHDGILDDVPDDILEEGWVSPIMYRMIEKPRPMITFPDPVY